MIPDNWFRTLSPAEVLAAVAASAPSLTEVSTWGDAELKRVGWVDNEVITGLYYLHVTTGIWTAKNLGNNSREVTDLSYVAARLLNGANSAADLLDAINSNLDSLVLCIDTNRLKTIETP